LTANAHPFAGYPPSIGNGGAVHPATNGYNHPDLNASQASFLGKDPYQHPTGYEIPQDYPLVPPAGFTTSIRPNYSGRADSDAEWQRRARMPTRGKTTRIKLTNEGNFSHDYPVPGPVRNSVEAKWMAMCACGR
jgi:hypothetical protein